MLGLVVVVLSLEFFVENAQRPQNRVPLLSSGADLTLRSYRGGGTALQKARKYRHTKLVELLEKHEMLNDADLEGVI